MIETDVLGFAQMLGRIATGVPAYNEHALTAAAKRLQSGVRATLGHYQTGNAQFPAWEPLKEETQRQRVRHGYSEDDPERVTGELAAHIEFEVELRAIGGEAAVGVRSVVVGDGSPGNEVRDIGEVALAQELGSPMHDVPQRSFLGLTAASMAEELAGLLGEGCVAEMFSVGGTPVEIERG